MQAHAGFKVVAHDTALICEPLGHKFNLNVVFSYSRLLFQAKTHTYKFASKLQQLFMGVVRSYKILQIEINTL